MTIIILKYIFIDIYETVYIIKYSSYNLFIMVSLKENVYLTNFRYSINLLKMKNLRTIINKCQN